MGTILDAFSKEDRTEITISQLIQPQAAFIGKGVNDMLDIDAAIKHCLDIADGQDKCAEISVSEHAKERISQCAADHRQLAEWLTELKEAKRLLKAAVEGMRWLNENTQDSYGSCTIRTEHGCSGCPFDINSDLFCKWKHEAEALALIGEDTNVPASADGTNVGHKSGDWISCKDRMPEVNEPVLFIFNTESGFKAVMYGWHETIKGLGSGWHQAGVGGARADEEVTYWQPLPEPPKDGDTNG